MRYREFTEAIVPGTGMPNVAQPATPAAPGTTAAGQQVTVDPKLAATQRIQQKKQLQDQIRQMEQQLLGLRQQMAKVQ
jgi:TolA-binding protein